MSSDTVTSISTSSTAPRLPDEIWDHIIFLASGHQPSLADFSLVCRAWLPASRFHFFRNLYVVLHHRNTGKLRSLMRSPHATLSRYFRHLVIWSQNETSSRDNVLLLPPFPSIQGLEIQGQLCVYFGSLPSQTLATKFPTLTSLELAFCAFATFDDVITLIASFPLLSQLQLKVLEVSSIGWSKIGSKHSARGSNLSLLCLSIEYGPIAECLAWLMSLGSLPPLHTLRLGYRRCGNISESSLNQFLRGLGSSLKNLRIDENATPFMKNVDISHNTELRTIHIEFAVYPDRPTAFEWIHNVLARTCSTSIETLIFQSYWYHGGGRIEAILYLQKLDQLLSEPRFSNLQQVQFLMETQSTSLVDMIEEKMSLCYSRGILFCQNESLLDAKHTSFSI